jgi:uncharacterized protein (TIGR03086 family)
MTPQDSMSLIGDPARLLERAIGYALGTLQDVTLPVLGRPTPCADWDVRRLLGHVNDSLDALCEGAQSGHIGPAPVLGGGGEAAADLVTAFRDRARRLLSAYGPAGQRDRVISVGDLPLTASIMAGVGAVEVTAHGWDISQACGRCRPIPAALATDLLGVAEVFVPRAGRRCLFAEPVPVPAQASPSDRLVAFLGRRPAMPGDARPPDVTRPGS